MGLKNFISKQVDAKKAKDAQRGAVEVELEAKMSQSVIFDALMHELDKHEWAIRQQGGSDYGSRSVKLTSDTIEIKWSRTREVKRIVGQNSLGIDQYKTEYVEDIFGSIVYSYTKSGFKPLSAYNGDVTIPLNRVVEIWGSVFRTKLASKIPGCTFSYVHNNSFNYNIPKPTRNLF